MVAQSDDVDLGTLQVADVVLVTTVPLGLRRVVLVSVLVESLSTTTRDVRPVVSDVDEIHDATHRTMNASPALTPRVDRDTESVRTPKRLTSSTSTSQPQRRKRINTETGLESQVDRSQSRCDLPVIPLSLESEIRFGSESLENAVES